MNGDLAQSRRLQAGAAAASCAVDGSAALRLRVPHRARDRRDRREGGSRSSGSWLFASSLDEEGPCVTVEPVSRVILDELNLQAEKTREVSGGRVEGNLGMEMGLMEAG